MDKYIGKMLDNRYEIMEVIGTGGMAFVYKAKCHRLNRLVAVKILKDEFAQDADFRRRFHAESHAVAMLSHPNIVAVYDVSRSSDVEYIIMELIDGITLKQYMQKKGQLNWRESLHFVSQIVKALSHAHGRGIIHRDIKPHNIMILRDGSVKVADFGIARFASVQNTLTQEALGSVHYISPEQARGSHIDARSDIYSVGVVLYEMLTSRLPFEGDSPVSIAIQHINSMPITPRDINPEIPEALEVITMKAMSPKLSRRYSSAEAMLHDLEEFRKNPSISFDYDQSELAEPADDVDEPTRKMQTGETREVIARTVAARSTARVREEEKKRVRREIEEEERYKVKKNNSLISVLTAVLAILVFIAGMGYLILSLFSNSNGNDSEDNVNVPLLVGRTLAEVQADTELPDLVYTEAAERKFSTQPEGTIIEQDPLQNTSVKAKSTVLVVVSKGADHLLLEDYSGREYRLVQSELSRLKLKCNTIPTYEASEDVPSGIVIRTNPASGSTVYEGDMVELIVSSGKVARKVNVPVLTDLPVSEAKELLKRYNLNVGVEISVDSEKPADTVVYQSVDAGTLVDEGTSVDLSVSLGPTVTPPPEESTPPGESAPPGTETPTPSPSASPGTETPSPSPSVTPTPSAPPVEEPITVTLPINLSFFAGESDTVLVTVLLNNSKYLESTEDRTQGTIYKTITGHPKDTVTVQFNGVSYYNNILEQVNP